MAITDSHNDHICLTDAQRESLRRLYDSAQRARDAYLSDTDERDAANWIAYEVETKILRFPVGLEQARRAVWLLRYWQARSTADLVGHAEQALYRDAADKLAAILLPEQLAVVQQNMPSRLRQ